MKKKLVATFLLVTVCLQLSPVIAFEFPSGESGTRTDGWDNIYGGLFLIGWSKSGRLAYLCDDSNSGVGVATSIYIQNLKNDKIEWSMSSEGDDMKTFWAKNFKEIEINLRKMGIIQKKNFEVKNFPFVYEGATISAQIIDSESLVLQSSTKGIKEIYRMPKRNNVMNYRTEEVEDLTPEIEGYVRSPYEARIAIILGERVGGFEGDYTHQQSLYGADLKSRFSQVINDHSLSQPFKE